MLGEVAWLRSLPVHPLAQVYLPSDQARIGLLVKDMKEEGLKRPVLLWGGALIDGRARLKAAELLGWDKLLYVEQDEIGYQALPEWLWVMNHQVGTSRRKDDSVQRSMFSYRLSVLINGPVSRRFPLPKLRNDEIRKFTQCSGGSYGRASLLYRKGTPELIAAAERGEIALATALRALDDPGLLTQRGARHMGDAQHRDPNLARSNAIQTIQTMGIVLAEHSDAPLPSAAVATEWITELEDTIQWLQELKGSLRSALDARASAQASPPASQSASLPATPTAPATVRWENGTGSDRSQSLAPQKR